MKIVNLVGIKRHLWRNTTVLLRSNRRKRKKSTFSLLSSSSFRFGKKQRQSQSHVTRIVSNGELKPEFRKLESHTWFFQKRNSIFCFLLWNKNFFFLSIVVVLVKTFMEKKFARITNEQSDEKQICIVYAFFYPHSRYEIIHMHIISFGAGYLPFSPARFTHYLHPSRLTS